MSNTVKLERVCSKPNIGSFQTMKLCKHFDKYGLNFQLMTKLKTFLICFFTKLWYEICRFLWTLNCN